MNPENNLYRNLIDKRLTDLIPSHSAAHDQLFAAARFALAEGKRLRPLLTLTVVNAYGLAIEKALTASCALELIHTYSLIHDDLPCMDDDDMRRGKPSLHKAFSESLALLTGDFLLTYAFEVIANDSSLGAPQQVALLKELAKAAGSEGMIGGQLIDLECNQSINEDTLLLIQTKKTASLFAACLIFGGILCEVKEEEIAALRRIGISLGIAFQFTDDFLDEKTSNPNIKQKNTEQLIQFYFKRALEELNMLTANQEILRTFFHTIIEEKLAEQTPL